MLNLHSRRPRPVPPGRSLVWKLDFVRPGSDVGVPLKVEASNLSRQNTFSALLELLAQSPLIASKGNEAGSVARLAAPW